MLVLPIVGPMHNFAHIGQITHLIHLDSISVVMICCAGSAQYGSNEGKKTTMYHSDHSAPTGKHDL